MTKTSAPWLFAAITNALLVPAAVAQAPTQHQHEPDVSVRTSTDDTDVDVRVEDDQPRPEALPRDRPEQRAGSEQACPQQEDLEARAGALREASGDIVRTKVVAIRGTNQENLVALIDTHRGNDRLVVDLGPVDAMRELRLGEGDRIAVEGRVHRVGDRQVLVASRIREGDRTRRIDRSGQAQHHARIQARLEHPGTTDQLALQERELEARSTPGLFQEPLEREMQDDDDFSDAQASVDVDVHEEGTD